jgi:hypothetical protein
MGGKKSIVMQYSGNKKPRISARVWGCGENRRNKEPLFNPQSFWLFLTFSHSSVFFISKLNQQSFAL